MRVNLFTNGGGAAFSRRNVCSRCADHVVFKWGPAAPPSTLWFFEAIQLVKGIHASDEQQHVITMFALAGGSADHFVCQGFRLVVQYTS